MCLGVAKHNIKMSSLPVPVDMKIQRKLSGASIVKMGQHSTEVLEDEKIDLSDLQLLMRLLGQHVEKSKLQRILDRSRTDGDDIDFPDFLKEIDGVIKDPCTESELRRAFRVFDNDNRGKVTFQEMRKAVDKFSTEVTLEIPELEELFVHINMTKDLTFEEMVAKSEKINRFKYGGSVNTAVQARRDARVSSHAAMNSEITVDEFIRTMDIIF